MYNFIALTVRSIKYYAFLFFFIDLYRLILQCQNSIYSYSDVQTNYKTRRKERLYKRETKRTEGMRKTWKN